MKIYISGAVTDVEHYAEHFADAEQRLKRCSTSDFKVNVLNPIHILSELPDSETTWSEYMDVSMALLKTCDAIYLLDGWENSRGANREAGYAMGKGMKILREGDLLEDQVRFY